MTTADEGGATRDYVTAIIAGQTFGMAIEAVHDVFVPQSMTRVPLAPDEIAGILNLRGRIVTAIDMRRRLALAPRGAGERVLAIGIEMRGEAFALLVDAVGEVLRLAEDGREAVPANLDPCWAQVAAGVHRLETDLMIVLDIARVLGQGQESLAA